jgi:mercuric reductase
MKVKGMTYDNCEVSVVRALEGAGAREAKADFRREEAVFAVEGEANEAKLAAAIREAGYRPGAIEVLEAERPSGPDRAASGDGYDVAIIGSGSAAFAAAIRARDLGARVVMVEEGTLGGTCVNIGCVPSKALLRAAEIYYLAGHHTFAGIKTSAGKVDLRALVGQKRELVQTLRHEKYEELVPAYDWEVVQGHAEFVDPETVSVDGRAIKASGYIIATGASPAAPPIEGLADAGYLTSTTALELEELPPTLAVIGANAIGLEMGQLFSHLGSKVTLIEILPRIAPFEEPEVSDAIAAVLREEGTEILTGAQVTRVEKTSDGKRLRVKIGDDVREIVVSDILVATGRRPNTAALGLDKAGVEVDERGAVVVDETLRTSNRRVWAAGDVTPSPQFVYVAAYQGSVSAENALNGNPREADLSVVPRITFTTPQIAAVGLTEEQAREHGHEVKTSVLPGEALARAWVNRDTRGLFKLVADASTDQLLGAHVVAENAGDVIYSAVIAIKYKLTVTDLVNTLAPYLTMAEGLKLAAQTFSRDVAKLSCCAG